METYKDEDTLKRMYHDERMSMGQMADELACSKQTISNWMDKFGIERRSLSEARQTLYATHIFDERGYERVVSGDDSVRVHRLIPIAHGADPYEIFEGANVHHKNGCPLDNRPSNLEVMEHGKHRSLHEGTLNAPWKDEEVLRYEYHNKGKTLAELSNEFGVAEQTVADWMDKFNIERRKRWEHTRELDRNESGDWV